MRQDTPMEDEKNLIQIRKEKIHQIRDELNVNPFPYRYDVTDFSDDIMSNFDDYYGSERVVSIAGRIMAMRIMGKASFCHIQDYRGRVQVYLKRDDIGEESYAVFKKLDIGDIIGVKGTVNRTKTGEITVFATGFTLLTKNIRPLPIVKEKEGEFFDMFADKELRYRNRHLDLIVNPQVKETFIKRIAIINTVKRVLNERDFLEVETPILQPLYGGAAASPFTSHHKALDMKLYLRISLEPYLKRLLVGGFDRVYEIGKCFRNEGIDRTHNPEFTMLELYQAYADYDDMMDITEEILEQSAIAVNGSTVVKYDGREIDFKRPWKRIKMADAISEHGGIDVLEMTDEEIMKKLEELGGEIKGEFNRGLAIDAIFEMVAEEQYIQPTFITHHPVETTPLCKPDLEDERFLQRFELFINGTELANAYSELNDPIFQRQTLYDQSLRREVDDEIPPLDENFIQAIEAGMPPAGGLGIGIDRLVMLLTGETSIRDVLFFPTMKPDTE